MKSRGLSTNSALRLAPGVARVHPLHLKKYINRAMAAVYRQSIDRVSQMLSLYPNLFPTKSTGIKYMLRSTPTIPRNGEKKETPATPLPLVLYSTSSWSLNATHQVGFVRQRVKSQVSAVRVQAMLALSISRFIPGMPVIATTIKTLRYSYIHEVRKQSWIGSRLHSPTSLVTVHF